MVRNGVSYVECKPPEGWAGPDASGHLSYVQHAASHADAPKRDGWAPYFVGVHGAAWTRWMYRRTDRNPCGGTCTGHGEAIR